MGEHNFEYWRSIAHLTSDALQNLSREVAAHKQNASLDDRISAFCRKYPADDVLARMQVLENIRGNAVERQKAQDALYAYLCTMREELSPLPSPLALLIKEYLHGNVARGNGGVHIYTSLEAKYAGSARIPPGQYSQEAFCNAMQATSGFPVRFNTKTPDNQTIIVSPGENVWCDILNRLLVESDHIGSYVDGAVLIGKMSADEKLWCTKDGMFVCHQKDGKKFVEYICRPASERVPQGGKAIGLESSVPISMKVGPDIIDALSPENILKILDVPASKHRGDKRITVLVGQMPMRKTDCKFNEGIPVDEDKNIHIHLRPAPSENQTDPQTNVEISVTFATPKQLDAAERHRRTLICRSMMFSFDPNVSGYSSDLKMNHRNLEFSTANSLHFFASVLLPKSPTRALVRSHSKFSDQQIRLPGTLLEEMKGQ